MPFVSLLESTVYLEFMSMRLETARIALCGVISASGSRLNHGAIHREIFGDEPNFSLILHFFVVNNHFPLDKIIL